MDPFVRITLGKAALAPETRVLKARDFQVFEQVRQVLADAEQKAREIRQHAEQEYEAHKARGYQAGMDEAQMAAAQQMMETVGRTVDYFSRLEQRMTEVVMTAVRKILGEFDDRTLTLQVVRNTLNTVQTDYQVTLRVNPAQEEHVRARLGEILKNSRSSVAGFPEVVADYRLQAGGCILETEVGVVDASIDVQLKALENALSARLSGGKEKVC